MQKQEEEIAIDIDLNDREEKILYSDFIYSIKTEVSRQTYVKCLKYYMKFLGVNTLKDLIDKKPQKIIESEIKAYLIYLRNQKKISYVTASLYLTTVRKFYHVNSEYNFKWDLISSYLGNDDTDNDNYKNNNSDLTAVEAQAQEQQDRPYSRTEIKQMFNAAQDIRVKIIISLMVSSGLRYGAVTILNIGDLERIEKYNLYQITAYRKSKKYKYYTFCSPECTTLIDSYFEYRKSKGEILKPSSPLIREQFNTKDKLKVNNPRHLTLTTFRFLINDVLTRYTTLRKKLTFNYENRRKEGRNPTMLTHGMRKFFTVECTKAGVYHEFVEIMLGHKLSGVRSHYMIPDTQTLLEGTKEVKGYVTAVDSLTINDENRLKLENQNLKQRDDQIDKRFKAIEEENKILNQKLIKYNERVQFNKVYEQKIDETVEAKYEEKKLNIEYESIPADQKRKKDSVFKHLMEARKKRIQAESDHMKLIREHIKKEEEDEDDFY